MTSTASQQYIAFLRGINVGGHHKVPMAELRKEMERIGYSDIITILNSGNIIFIGHMENAEKLEKKIALHLEEHFKFPIPVVIRKTEEIHGLIEENPFKAIDVTKDIRLYISFLTNNPPSDLKIPYSTQDKSFRIITIIGNNIFSLLDLSKTKTVKGMEVLEKLFGKNITTRNWNTILRISEKL